MLVWYVCNYTCDFAGMCLVHAHVHSCPSVFQCVHAWCADPRVCFCPYKRVCSPVQFARAFSNVLPVFRKDFFFLSLQKDSLLSLFPRSESWSQPGLGTVTDTAPPSVNISCTRCRVKWLDGPWAVLRISLPENPFHSPLPETSLLLLVLSRSTEILHFVLLYLLCRR